MLIQMKKFLIVLGQDMNSLIREKSEVYLRLKYFRLFDYRSHGLTFGSTVQAKRPIRDPFVLYPQVPSVFEIEYVLMLH